MLFRNYILLLIVSVIAVFFYDQVKFILLGLAHAQYAIAGGLGSIIAGGKVGYVIRQTIALFIIPFIVGVFFWIFCYFAKRKVPMVTIVIMWVIWIAMLTAVSLR